MLKWFYFLLLSTLFQFFLIKAVIISTYFYAAKLSRAWCKLIPLKSDSNTMSFLFNFLDFPEPKHFFFLNYPDPYTYIIPKTGKLGKNSAMKLIKILTSVSLESHVPDDFFLLKWFANLGTSQCFPDSQYIYSVYLRKKYTAIISFCTRKNKS